MKKEHKEIIKKESDKIKQIIDFIEKSKIDNEFNIIANTILDTKKISIEISNETKQLIKALKQELLLTNIPALCGLKDISDEQAIKYALNNCLNNLKK